MRKFPYTRVPIDSPGVMFKGSNALWEPLLRVRIGIPKGKRSPRFRAYVDSGSPWCIFRADIGDFLGLEVEKGEQAMTGGIIHDVREPIYFHRVSLFIEDHWMIQIRAGFMRKLQTHGILGRDGFFDQFRVGFDQSLKPPIVELEKIETIQ